MLGCEESFPENSIEAENGFTFEMKKRGRGHHGVAWRADRLCRSHYNCLTQWRESDCTAELNDFHARWPMRTERPTTLEHIWVRFKAETGVRPAVSAKFQRQRGEHVWQLNEEATRVEHSLSDQSLASIPQRATICGTDHVPVRTAKIHTAFREKLLRRMLDAQSTF